MQTRLKVVGKRSCLRGIVTVKRGGVAMAVQNGQRQCRSIKRGLEEPKLLWMRKLTLGVMVSGNAADDD